MNAADWKLASTPPTTLAGVAAILRFANRFPKGGRQAAALSRADYDDLKKSVEDRMAEWERRAADEPCLHQRRNARNPLRKHLQNISIAVTEGNKIDHSRDDWREWIRKGAESARVLAEEPARIAERGEP